MITRSRVWKGIFRGVKNMDVFPAASMDGFTAARKIPFQTRRRRTIKSSFLGNPGRLRGYERLAPGSNFQSRYESERGRIYGWATGLIEGLDCASSLEGWCSIFGPPSAVWRRSRQKLGDFALLWKIRLHRML